MFFIHPEQELCHLAKSIDRDYLEHEFAPLYCKKGMFNLLFTWFLGDFIISTENLKTWQGLKNASKKGLTN